MDRHEAVAKKWHHLRGVGDGAVYIEELTKFLREQYPERGHGERLREAVKEWFRTNTNLTGFTNYELSLAMSAWLESRGFFAEPEQRGTCGECRWWGAADDTNLPVRLCRHPKKTVPQMDVWPTADASCPCFERREDKAARLAREYFESRDIQSRELNEACLAAFLRANGVGEE